MASNYILTRETLLTKCSSFFFLLLVLKYQEDESNTVSPVKSMIIIGWQNLNRLSHPNPKLAPLARQERPSGEILNYIFAESLV